MTRQPHQDDQQSRVFYELSALILNLLRHPPTPIQFSDEVSTSTRRQPRPAPLSQITPAGFASLLLGISLALMLCGSITFFIGFLLMPWVLGLVMLFYVAGIISSISMLGRAIFCHTLSPSSPRKSVPGMIRLLSVLYFYTSSIWLSNLNRTPHGVFSPLKYFIHEDLGRITNSFVDAFTWDSCT